MWFLQDFKYDGKAKTGVAAGTGYTLSGTTSATKAGKYKVTATPDKNHCWPDGSTTAKEITWTIVGKALSDVPEDAWYTAVVTRAVGLGIIGGYSDGSFGPDDLMTRGQTAVILWNMAGKPQAGAGAKTFSDVKSSDYFYNAVRWATSKGVVSGYTNGKFGADDSITREQFAVMLANYAKNVAGRQVSGSAADFATMSDRAEVSSWAVPSVGWCCRNKIFTGSGGKITPKGKAKRAEAAKMVVVLYDLLA